MIILQIENPNFPNESNRRGIEGKSASGSDINSKNDDKKGKISRKSSKSVAKSMKDAKNVKASVQIEPSESKKNQKLFTPRSTTSSNDATGKTLSSIQVFSGKVIGKSTNTYTKSTKPNKEAKKTNNVESTRKPREGDKTCQDFSQNFPTPRDLGESISAETQLNGNNIDSISATSVSETSTSVISTEKTGDNSNENLSTNLTPKVDKRKSFAYYLPLQNDSPIKIGTRVLREKSLEGSLNKENRNILSNYISAIDSSVVPFAKKKSRKKTMNSESSTMNSVIETPKTLQDALLENKSDFIQKSECRVEILRQIKEERCLYSEMRRNMLENIAKDAPKNQVRNIPLTSIPKPKPRRLFDYKEMVKETRRKYECLPEVLNAKYEARRTSSYRTNRLMADIYQRKLKGHVLKGKISMNHNFNIIT